MFHIGLPGPLLQSHKGMPHHLWWRGPKRAKKVKKSPKALRSLKITKVTKVVPWLNRKPFLPYTGLRWEIPSGIKVSQSQQFKFSMFENNEMNTVFGHINSKIKRPITFLSVNFVFHTWKPPKQIVSAIQRNRDLQINEFKQVKSIYIKIFTFLYRFAKLVYTWRINKCMRNIKNTSDPVTLDVPKMPVYVIDFKQKSSYVYEASTLRRTIENKLLYSDYMFPTTSKPINLLTNEPFTYGQLLSIITQCASYGEFSWVLDRFKSCNCDITIFGKRFKQILKINAIETYFKCYKDARESVVDYFESQAEASDFPVSKISKFSHLYIENTKRAPHSYIQKWINLTKQYYIAAELHDHLEMILIDVESDRLLMLGKSIF